MSSLLSTITLFAVVYFLSADLKSEVQESQTFKKISPTDALTDERLFDLISIGISKVDKQQLRADLLSIQPQVNELDNQAQAFYWYNVAISARLAGLSSYEVITPIQTALSFNKMLSPHQQFKMLVKAIHLCRDYQQYELLITYIEQLRQLTLNELDPATQRLPEEYENLKARAYFQTGQLEEAELLLEQLISQAESHNSPQNINWYSLLSQIHRVNKEDVKRFAILQKQMIFFPSKKLEEEIVALQRKD
ncbi:hypothetical protein [Flavobacterium sp. W21_SRS_FM6]|uniref:hypothetical protein n=1 Tax=Flavobacterium sp. W21_SRS_FM6 TaxID=3240268 RepID=UPI003F91FC92